MKRIAIGFLFLIGVFHAYSEDNTTDSQNLIATEKVDTFSVVADSSSDVVKDNIEEEKIWKSYIKKHLKDFHFHKYYFH